MGGWSTKGFCLCLIMLIWVATGIVGIPSAPVSRVSARPSVPYSLRDWEYISKPVLPVQIDASEIEIGSHKTFVYPLEEGKMYRVYCYGEWIDYTTETNKTDYDIFVYDPSGRLESYHTESAGLPEHLGTTVDHPFFIPQKTGDYSFQIKNDARESNGAQAATLMIIEHIETDQWYELDMEGKVNDKDVEKTTWAYEFNTINTTRVEVVVQVPDDLDMYEARLYMMANPTANVGTILNGLPLPIEEGLYGTMSGTYGGYNLDSEGKRINNAMASCEYPGEDMLINFTAPVQGDLLYHLGLIAEHGDGTIRFMVKTDFEVPELSIVNEVEKAEPNKETTITAHINEQFNLDTVTLNYTKNSGETYTTTEMVTEQNQIFTATIPGQAAGTLINYTVVAKDVSCNVAEFVGSYWVKNSENITLEVSSPVVDYGETVSVSGSVRGSRSNVTLTYELLNSAPVNTAESTKTESPSDTPENATGNLIVSRVVPADASGVFLDTCSMSKSGKWLVCASWNGTETYFGTTSEPESFTVLKTYISVTCNVTSKTVAIGDNITVTGFVEPKVENFSVNLVFIDINTTTTQKVLTDENGTYVLKWKPTTMGLWRVHANIAGNESVSASYSNVTTFTVTDTFLNQYMLYIIGGGGGVGGVCAVVFIRKRREEYD